MPRKADLHKDRADRGECPNPYPRLLVARHMGVPSQGQDIGHFPQENQSFLLLDVLSFIAAQPARLPGRGRSWPY
jgi:hypothetical protein